MSFRSTSFTSGKSISEISTSIPLILRTFWRTVEAPAAPVALERIGGIGDLLELLQNELGDYQRPVHETRLANVGDAAVDDDAGIEYLDVLRGRGPAEIGDHREGIEPTRPS